MITYFSKSFREVSYVNLCYAGSTIASFCYLQFFPPPYDIDGMSMNCSFHPVAIDVIAICFESCSSPDQSSPILYGSGI